MTYRIPDIDLTTHFTPLQMFQYYDKYSKFRHDEGRRETWSETVTRSVDFLRELSDDQLRFDDYQAMFDMIYTGDVSPSMRLFAHAGDAIRRDNEMLYNCSYHVIDDIKAFSEFLWLSMCGCGIATSVESKFVNKLPTVSMRKTSVIRYAIQDTAKDWKLATDLLIHQLWLHGNDVQFDYSKIRSAGSILYTKGGYSSGPDVLKDIHEFIRMMLKKAEGRKLTTIEVFDLFTKLPDAGISGGVRRAAALCLFDYDDMDMHQAKYDGFWSNPQHAHRANANISAVWPEVMTRDDIYELTSSLFSTGSGEPGFFKRSNALRTAPQRRNFDRPDMVGTNACGEIILESEQFCNLSTVICKPRDSYETLKRKTRIATLIGGIQSLATNFRLRSKWQENCKRDRLLGVNHIGHANCKVIRDPMVQQALACDARDTDVEFAELFNVPLSASITAVKPSGNSSVLFNVGPGINPIHDKYSIRNVTVNTNTAMFRFLRDYGVKYTEYPGKEGLVMFAFPYWAPQDSITLDDVTAIEQLEYWKQVKTHLTEHNPSCSIVYNQGQEEDGIIDWLYNNQQHVGGLTFFPHFDNSYGLCPVQRVDKHQISLLNQSMPNIDWSILKHYESKDETNHVIECSGGRCDL